RARSCTTSAKPRKSATGRGTRPDCCGTAVSHCKGTIDSGSLCCCDGEVHPEASMLYHIGICISDYDRAKTFYDKALAPLGIALVMEVSAEDTGDQPAAGFGSDGKPYFWFGGGTVARAHV